MRVPAAVAAVAILIGTTGACFTTLTGAIPAAIGAASWVAALAAYRRGRSRAVETAGALAVLATSWALAAPPFRDAEAPPLSRVLAHDDSSADPVALRGRLRADAAVAPAGVALDLDVRSGGERGGVRLAVFGALAGHLAGEWRAGRTVTARASLRLPGRYLDPGVPDARLDLARRGTVLVGTVKSGALVDVVSRGGWFDEGAASLRRFARESIGRHVGRRSARSAAIVIAILIGDRVGLDQDVQRRLREAGTYHVIAISGGNIAILAGVLLVVLRACRVRSRPACWMTIAGLSGYAAVVGGGASVVRATLMAVSYLLARQADHRGPALNALAVACGAILLAAPTSLTDVGFALTFGATLGILVGARFMSQRVNPWLRAPLALLVASISAELALLPVAAWAFSRVTFAGLILNFVAIPLMSVAQVAGMAVLPLAGLSEHLASAAGVVAHLGADGLVRSASLVDLAPWLSWRLPPPHWIVVACYYAGWCAWLVLRGDRARRWASRAALAAACASGVWILVEPATLLFPGVSGALRVVVLDVGSADAILVQLPDRRSLLVDTGGAAAGGGFDIGGRVIAPALWALGTRRLDALVLSHGDPDHVGGAASVVRDFRPRQIWEGIPVPSSGPLAALGVLARERGIAWRSLRAGDTLRFGEVAIRILHPPEPDWERRKVRNDDSLVLDVRYRGVSIVLPGDIGREVERTLLPSLVPAGVCVLKVPHHGSASSSSAELLDALHPDVAIVSAGLNARVKEETLGAYRAVGATLLRTSHEGAVTVMTADGQEAEVSTFTGRRFRLTPKEETIAHRP